MALVREVCTKSNYYILIIVIIFLVVVIVMLDVSTVCEVLYNWKFSSDIL